MIVAEDESPLDEAALDWLDMLPVALLEAAEVLPEADVVEAAEVEVALALEVGAVVGLVDGVVLAAVDTGAVATQPQTATADADAARPVAGPQAETTQSKASL